MMDLHVHQDNTLVLEGLESTRQELHDARRQIDILRTSVKYLENENVELSNALSEFTKNHKDSQSYDQRKSNLVYKQQIEELQQMLEKTQTSDSAARETVKILERQLQSALADLAAGTSITAQDVDYENEIATLQFKISKLEEEKDSIKQMLYTNAMELKMKTDENARLEQEIAKMEEETECMNSQFSSQCDINERLREEISELRTRLESGSAHVDTQKKGNSLFAEVDDRRVIAETRIVKLESVTGGLQEKLTKEQQENKRLKLQILQLRQTSNRGYNNDIVHNLEGQLLDSKRLNIQKTEQLQKITEQLQKMKEQLQKMNIAKYKSEQEVPISVTSDNTEKGQRFIHFMESLIDKKEKEAAEAKVLAEQNHMQALRTELCLSETENKIRSLTCDCDKLKDMNSHLTLTVQEMQRKYEPELFESPSKAKMKIPVSQLTSIPLSQQDKLQQSQLTSNPLSQKDKLQQRIDKENQEGIQLPQRQLHSEESVSTFDEQPTECSHQ